MKRSTKGDLKKSSLADFGTINSVGRNAEELLRGTPADCRERVYTAYLAHNREMLCSTSLPWFLPEHLGGLGLPILGERKPSKKDLRLAAVLYHHYKIPSRPQEMEWKVWQYAKKRIPETPQTAAVLQLENTVGQGKSSEYRLVPESAVYGKLCIEAMFRCDGIKHLYEEAKTSGEKKPLRKMEELIRTAMKSKHFAKTEPFTPEALAKKKLVFDNKHVLMKIRSTDELGVLTSLQRQGTQQPEKVNSYSLDAHLAFQQGIETEWQAFEEQDW